ncbi:MAG: cytochrome c [Acidobacteriota bacterium]
MNVRAPSVIQLAKLSFLLTPALGGAEVAAAQANDPSTWDTGTLYQRACAACHGSDGSGLAPDHPNYANFESPPADLTDPLFNSREPSADWSMVVKYGGARLGLSAQMPAYGSALTDEQIDDLVAYLKQLVDTSRYPPGDLNFNRPVVTVKAFPEDEVLLINRFSRGSDDTPDAFRTTLYHARRFGARGQAEAKFSYISFNSGDDLAELELEYKRAVHFNLKQQIINSLGIELAIPFSSDDEEVALIPYWSFGKGLSDSVTFQSNLRAALPVDEPGDGAARLSGIFHWMPSPWPRSVSPALEFTVTEPFESDADTLFTLIPQLYIGLSKGGHVALAVGVEVPVSDIDYDYRIHTFLLWDIADGPLWAGW